MFFFDDTQRKTLCKEKDYGEDSHTSICLYYDLIEDKTNKYEYSPLTTVLVDDQINAHSGSDRQIVLKSLENFDFKTICPELVIKPIIYPFLIERSEKISDNEIKLLEEWISVGDSVGDSVRDSIWISVGNSVWDSVGRSVRDSIWISVGNSVGNSVWDSVGRSVRDSVWAYISSFFILKSWKNFEHPPENQNPFQSGIDLWEVGLVPSFDGTTWRLHSGKNAKIVYERKI